MGRSMAPRSDAKHGGAAEIVFQNVTKRYAGRRDTAVTDVSRRGREALPGGALGQRRRIGVARAMAADLPIMLVDEPLGAIDPITRERLQNDFLRLHQEIKKTVVSFTHDIDEAIWTSASSSRPRAALSTGFESTGRRRSATPAASRRG